MNGVRSPKTFAGIAVWDAADGGLVTRVDGNGTNALLHEIAEALRSLGSKVDAMDADLKIWLIDGYAMSHTGLVKLAEALDLPAVSALIQ